MIIEDILKTHVASLWFEPFLFYKKNTGFPVTHCKKGSWRASGEFQAWRE